MKTGSLSTVARSTALAVSTAALEELTLSPAAAAELDEARVVAEILAALDAEESIQLGVLCQPLLHHGVLTDEAAARRFGPSAATFARELVHLGTFRATAQWQPDQPLSATQAEALRKMLLAVVADPRLVLARLATQLARMRKARDLPPLEQQRLARETREVYAPLASRLGIWQLKWELEDLAFRYLDAEQYRQIASLLAERREAREDYIATVTRLLRDDLAAVGISAEVSGRPKHIYSIWRKMQRKHLPFERVLDVRAVRVIVDTVADCYAALGIVHGRWPYLPGEFDDYIATPKDNAYRSLHTAVLGPGGVPLEVQIRTREMHEHAELGVAAHWRYKEGAARDAAYDRKIQWLRELLSEGDGARRGVAEGDTADVDTDFLDRVRSELFEDRVYVLTPKGEVIDLPKDATPLDYAYHVHTNLGHRCRGAKVNGRLVPLDYRLKNGEVVEILTGKQPQPSRDWLVEQLGYLASPRNRAKVRAWFRKQDEGRNREDGRALYDRELERLGVRDSVPVDELLEELGTASVEDLYLALGAGDLTAAQLAGALQRRLKAREQPAPPAEVSRVWRKGPVTGDGIAVQGIGDLLSTLARCCAPVPPEPVVGYVTVGRGVTIHRADCPNLLRLQAKQPERVLSVDWGLAGGSERRFPVDLAVSAYDRHGLVRDVSAVLADAKVNIERLVTTTNAGEGTAQIELRVTVGGLEELSRLVARIATLPNVYRVRRR